MDTAEVRGTRKVFRIAVRRIAQLGLAVLLLALLFVFAWVSGLMQRYIIPAVVEHVAGIRVSLRTSGFSPLYIHGLELRDPAADPALPPLLRAGEVRLDWESRFPSKGRPFIKNMRLSDVSIHLDATNPARTNYAFLLQGGSSLDVSPFLPKALSMERLSVNAALPSGTGQVAGIDAVFTLRSLEAFTAEVRGDHVRAGWQNAYAVEAPSFPEGTVLATLRREGAAFHLEANVGLPGFLLAKGNASLERDPAAAFDVQVDQLRAEGPILSELLSPLLPVPLTFTSLTVIPAKLKGAFANGRLSLTESTLDMRAEDLCIGAADAPWYQAPLHLEAQGAYDTAAQASFKATLNRKQVVSGTLLQAGDALNATLVFEDWDGEQVAAIVPAPLEGVRACLDHLMQASGSLSCSLEASKLPFEATLSPVFEQDFRPQVTVHGAYDFATGLTVSGDYAASPGNIAWDGTFAPETGISVTAKASSMPASALAVLMPTTEVLAVDMPFDGSLSLKGIPGQELRFQTALTSTRAQWKDYVLPDPLTPLAFDVKGTVPADLSVLVLNTATLKMGESTSFTLSSGKLSLADMGLRGKFQAAAEVEPLAAMFGIRDAWGAFTGEGDMTLTRDMTLRFTPATVVLDPLGYGDYALPYGQPLTLRANAAVDVFNTSLHLEQLRANLGEGTTLEVPETTLTPDSMEAPGTLSFKTDFAPFVSKGYLAAATGTLEATLRDFRLGSTGTAGEITYRCDASDISLPDAMADLSGVLVQGTATLQSEPAGQGEAAIDTLRAAGVNVEAIKGAIHTQGSATRIEDGVLSLFGGTVDARIEVRPFETGLPLNFSGAVKDLDLDVFTKEFKPESVVLTGKVNGAFSAGLVASQLTALDVDLESTENFSMNRATVEQLLMRQYMGDMAGGKKMQRMVQDIIGKDEQRTFDSAATKLGLEDGRITGYVKLVSEKLNLTLDVKADPEALLEALRIRQGEED